jgi:hypothetical protein
VLGVCGLYPSWFDGGDPDETDLGYRYGRAAWGQGYGYEAAAEVMRWAVEERGLDRVGSNVQARNIASHKILQRLGFTFVDTRPVPSDPSRTAHWYVWVAHRCEERQAPTGQTSLTTARLPRVTATHPSRHWPDEQVGPDFCVTTARARDGCSALRTRRAC